MIAATGARWSAAPMRAWMPLGWEEQAAPALATLAGAEIDDASAESAATTLATRLTLTWGEDWASGGPRGSVVVEAPEAVARVGLLAAERSAPWLRTARDAERLARGLLAELARPAWRMDIRIGPPSPQEAPWRPGDRLSLAHPWLPAGTAEIAELALSPLGRRLTLTRPAGPAPRVVTLRHGAALDARTGESSVSYRDGVATFTILDEAGAPIAGAAVTLDGAQTRYTDRLGRVSFGAQRGAHTLLVVAHGYATFELEVTV